MKGELMEFSFFVALFLALVYAKNKEAQKYPIPNSSWKSSGQGY
jgi:hypothetical protein